jgi:hypothetical protein
MSGKPLIKARCTSATSSVSHTSAIRLADLGGRGLAFAAGMAGNSTDTFGFRFSVCQQEGGSVARGIAAKMPP